MDATRLFEKKQSTYIELERYVNNGSPSGFTELKTTSLITSPFHGADVFPLLEFPDDDFECIALGSSQRLFERGVNYAHPDSERSTVLRDSGRKLTTTNFNVSPTAGGRTMLLRTPPLEGYLKLTYDIARLGRVDRQLSLKLCQSSLEVTGALKECIDTGKCPLSFALLLESSAKISLLATSTGTYEWGTIYREALPYPHRPGSTQLVPGFSLFSADRHNPADEPLINQFIRLRGGEPRAYLINLLRLIVDCYWCAVLNCAFHPELHAQNCLFEVDESFNIARLVLLDMQSVDKDIPLARTLGLRDAWESYPESCFDESIYFYKIRPSYVYDFKVGEYLLSEIIKVVADRYQIDTAGVEREIQEYVRCHYTSKLPRDYFPLDGYWYDCDRTERLPGQRRQYYPHPNPKFR